MHLRQRTIATEKVWKFDGWLPIWLLMRGHLRQIKRSFAKKLIFSRDLILCTVKIESRKRQAPAKTLVARTAIFSITGIVRFATSNTNSSLNYIARNYSATGCQGSGRWGLDPKFFCTDASYFSSFLLQHKFLQWHKDLKRMSSGPWPRAHFFLSPSPAPRVLLPPIHGDELFLTW